MALLLDLLVLSGSQFKHGTENIFIENLTPVQVDKQLIKWFECE